MTGQTAQAAPPEKFILDTDIGDDIDDVYALALLAAAPNARLLGVTTAFGETPKRAALAAKFLKVMGRGDVPVYAGRPGEHKIRQQFEWARDFRSPAIKREEAVAFLRRALARYPGEVTLIAIGPLTNLGDLLTRYPDARSKIKRIVIMGGAVYVGYTNQPPPTPEWNIKCDPEAAKIVFESGVPLTMAGLEVTTMLKFDAERQKRLYAHGTPMTDALAALTALWGQSVPTLYDVMAVAWALDHKFCGSETGHVEVEPTGLTRLASGPPNATILVRPEKDAFLDWCITALAPPVR